MEKENNSEHKEEEMIRIWIELLLAADMYCVYGEEIE